MKRGMVRLLTAAVIGMSGLVAGAGGAQAAGPGWYGSAPFTIDWNKCSEWGRLASGSDGLGMYARSCIVQVRNGVAQGITVFSNTSHSNVVATAKNTITDARGVVQGGTYQCGNKTLPANGVLYCVGAQTGFSPNAANYMEAYVNNHGTTKFSRVIYAAY